MDSPSLSHPLGHRAMGETLLYLTDEQLRQGIEAMFFAYRGFTADPDRILELHGYGPITEPCILSTALRARM